MKKCLLVVLLFVLFVFGACGKETEEQTEIKPQISQMKTICELATMDCYFHNVAKFEEKDVEKNLFGKTKDKRFWIEYAGVVTLGIDVSEVKMEVLDTTVTISLPPAEVLGCRVDETTLSKESFYIDKKSADISAEDEIEAYSLAQEMMKQAAEQDTILLKSAQQRAQDLLEDYIHNIGEAIGVTYTVEWIYIEAIDSKIQ